MLRRQQTIGRPVSFSGVGIHQGNFVSLTLFPAPENTGKVFRRDDLPSKPLIPATADQVCENARSTSVGNSEVFVQTVEHVLAALHAFQIDNVILALTGAEPPVGNGSSDVFVDLIEQAGVVEQNLLSPFLKVEEPIYCEIGDSVAIALPSDSFKISYTLSYPQSELVGTQFFSLEVTPSTFKKELSKCRTFALEEEVLFLKEKGLIKGGSLDNAVLIGKDKIHAKGGLVFPDEMVRHKVLDIVGDLALTGADIFAHIIAIKSGHRVNCLLAKEMMQASLSSKR